MTHLRYRLGIAALVALLLSPALAAAGAPEAEPADPLSAQAPRSVILFIGDGMGYEHVRAAQAFRGGESMEDLFPHHADVETQNASGEITDSAAAATAMATGRKAHNGVIAQARPGSGADLPTVVDSYTLGGRSFGLVTTSELTHATPAAFAAHTRSRTWRRAIARDYLTETLPEVMIGGGGAGLSVGDVEEAGYEVHTDLKRLADRELSASRADPVNPVAVLLGKGHLPYRADAGDSSAERPALADMVDAALDRLSADPDGFFLLVEAARIDHASHDNDIRRALAETVDLLEAVERTLARLDGAESDDVLVVLTADHETGGLSVSRTAPIGTRPDVEWSTGGHTARPVPVYARGPFSEHVIGTLDNTDLYSLMLGRPLIKD